MEETVQVLAEFDNMPFHYGVSRIIQQLAPLPPYYCVDVKYRDTDEWVTIAHFNDVIPLTYGMVEGCMRCYLAGEQKGIKRGETARLDSIKEALGITQPEDTVRG